MTSQFGKVNGKYVGLLKHAWHEIPDIVGGTVLAVASAIGCIAVYLYRDKQGTNDIKRYKLDYTVVRSDDPLAKYAPPRQP